MLLEDFLANKSNPHSVQGQLKVVPNAFYKAKENVNCYLTPSQAMELAKHLLEKAQMIIDNNIEDGVVHLWNQGTNNEKLYLGLNTARKGPRRNKKKA